MVTLPMPQTEAIHFAVGGAVFGDLKPGDVELMQRLGFPGFEPYRGWIMPHVEQPQAFKELLDQHGISLITCSNGGPNQSTEFIDPAQRQQTVDDHVAFARDFLSVFGCKHFKINMGRRPAGGPTREQITAIAQTCNEIGRRTADMGIMLAPHPHIWGPIERPEEVVQLIEQTDPERIHLCLDTAQINLGGGDPVALTEQYYDRICSIHWKDSRAEYRGHTGPTPTQEQHRERILYRDLGTGGVDIAGHYQLLIRRGYRYWITLDLDPPRPQEGEGTPEEKLRINHRYLIDTLHVPHL